MRVRPPLRRTACLLVALALVGSVASATTSSYNGVTTNPTSNFTAAASFGCAPAINPVWMTGFEHGVAAGAASSGLLDVDWNIGSTITADTATKRNGGYALKIVKGSPATTGGRSRTVSSSLVVFRIAFRFSFPPTGDVTDFMSVKDSTGDDRLNIGYNNASQKVSVGFAGGSAQLSASTISAGTWYVLDVRANYGTDPHTADWQLNAVPQTSASKSKAGENAASVSLGPDSADAAFTAWYDDLLISQTSGNYPIGDGKVLGLVPDAMGTSSDPSARLSTEAGAWGSTTWNKLDEIPMTSTADYVRQTVVDGSAYLETTFANTAETCITAVMGELAYHASTTGGNTAKTSLFESGAERVVYNGSMATTTLSYRSAMIAPASGAWTQAKVNGLTAQIGFTSAMLGQPYWDALMVEYNVDL